MAKTVMIQVSISDEEGNLIRDHVMRDVPAMNQREFDAKLEHLLNALISVANKEELISSN